MCRRQLVHDATETDDESLVGEIAHIVAAADQGSRGDPTMTNEARNRADNLILLCGDHHKLVDDQQNTYTVEKLRDIKRVHEATVSAALSPAEKEEQRDDSIYAAYVDEWLDRLERWGAWTNGLMQAQPTLLVSDRDALRSLVEYIFRRIWPKRYPELENAFHNFRFVLSDLLSEFERHAHEDHPGQLWTEKFYKREWHPTDKYQQLLEEYEFHNDLISDLVLETARAANYVADMVRQYIDSSFRLDEGAFVVTAGMGMDLRNTTYRVEYRADERVQQPYPGLKAFGTDRAKRDVHFGPRGYWDDLPDYMNLE